jgi:alpha-L-fucosidase
MKLLISILYLSSAFYTCQAQSVYQPSPENLAARKWFDSARFGMFIHWGAFSVPGSGNGS